MVQVLFDPGSTRLVVRQSGEGAFYEGRVFQRGRGIGHAGRYNGEGIGDVLRNVWQYLKPMAMGAAKSVGQEGLEAGGRILSNLAQGANLKDTVKQEGKEGVRRALERASRRFQRGRGLPNAYARRLGKKSIKGRKASLHPEVILKPEDILIGKSVAKSTALKKRAKKDNLGLY